MIPLPDAMLGDSKGHGATSATFYAPEKFPHWLLFEFSVALG